MTKSLYLLDSGVLIKYLRGDARAAELIQFLHEPIKPLISAITVTEIMVGTRTPSQIKDTTSFLQLFQVVPVSSNVAGEAAKLIKVYPSLFGPKIARGVADALIAACAIEKDATLISLNTRQFSNMKNKELNMVILKESSPPGSQT